MPPLPSSRMPARLASRPALMFAATRRRPKMVAIVSASPLPLLITRASPPFGSRYCSRRDSWRPRFPTDRLASTAPRLDLEERRVRDEEDIMKSSMHDTDSTRDSQVPPPDLGCHDWLSQLHNDNVSVGGLADKNAGVGNMAEKATRPGDTGGRYGPLQVINTQRSHLMKASIRVGAHEPRKTY